MTILTIMRHAKSDWGQPGLADFDRPLNERGRKAAKAIGKALRQRHVGFDQVFASPALRVRETLAHLEKGFDAALPVCFEQQLYGADESVLEHVIRAIPASVHAPLLVGHNPGLQQLVLALTRADEAGLRDRVAAKFATVAVAVIELDAVRWDEVAHGSGKIAELIVPKDLD
jgi:phosphohistidine phosphatase